VATLPALVPFQVPNFNLGDTFTQMARLSAYEQSRRTSALEEEEKRGKLDRDRLWRSTIAGAFPTTDPRAPAGLNALPPQVQAQPQMPAQALPVTGGLAGPQQISQGPSTMGPTGMASQVPVNQPMDVNPQTGEWSTPGGLSAPPTSPMAPGGLTQPPPAMPSAITALAQPAAPGQPPLQGGGLTLAQPQSSPTGQPGASTGTLGGPQPSRPLEAMVPGLMPMPDMRAVQQAFAIDPEKTSTWYSAYLTQRGKQLEEVTRNNELVHQVTGAMLDNPAYYKEGLELLRSQGVPVPKNMPAEYNPALVKFHYDTSGKRLDPLQEAQRQTYLADAAFKKQQGLTEEANRAAVIRFREGQGGPPGAGGGAGGGTTAAGGQTTTAPAEVETALQDAIKQFPKVRPEIARAIIAQESNFDQKAVSSAGAQGYMQLMPATQREMGVKDPFDTRQNILGGVGYFDKLLTRYGGDEQKALAAYNAGPGRVDAAKGDLKALPKETQDYVPKVLQRAGAGGGGATTPAASGRMAELRQQIAAKQQRANEASTITPLAGAATQLRSEITDLRQELTRLEDQAIAERHRTEPSQARIAEQEAGRALAPIERTMAESISTNKSIHRSIGKMEQVMREGTDLPANLVNLVAEDAPEIQRMLQADPKEWTGFLEGYATKLRAATSNDPRVNRFLSALANMRDLVIFERSGGSVTGNELTRATGAFFGSLPNVNQAFSLFMENMANVKETIVDRLVTMGASVRPLSGGKAVYGGLPKDVRERIEAYEKGEEPPKAQMAPAPKVVRVTPVP
jgi:Transglycosylase SLT domain